MGNLPECRLVGVVFRNTGVDVFGPMLVKEKRSEVKVYGCLFVCMSTRACHLELVDDLSTDHFIMALKRFIFILSTHPGQDGRVRAVIVGIRS